MNRQRQTHLEKNIICILISICILCFMFMAAVNILIGCEVMSSEELPHMIFYYIIDYIRWVIILCIFFFYLKALRINHKYRLKSGITILSLPFFILFIIIYTPFQFLMFPITIWIVLDFITTVYLIYMLLKIMTEVND
ncbi:MAG: hypothetical protein GY756_02145 [bacterium]|nr:hypothetical protein [bacterium]